MIACVNGIRLFYEKTGQGRPLVMVHGNGEDHTIFDEAVAELSESFTCYCVDSRCHGQSSETGELHYTDMAADMRAFLEALELRDAVFYGFSDGGIVALLAAAGNERVTTLITSGANTSPRGVKLSLRLAIAWGYLRTRDKKLRLMLREPQISDRTLASIRARTLVLAGEGDLIPEKETRHIAAAVPGARLKLLPGEDHGSYIVHSSKIAGLIKDFVQEETQ